MKTQIKTLSLVVVVATICLSLGTAGAQQNNNNRQQQQQTADPNAPRGAITGSVVEQGRGIPVKKAQVALAPVRNPQTAVQQPAASVPVGAAGTTAAQGQNFGGTVGTAAAGQTGRTAQGNNNNNNNFNNNNGQNNNAQGRGNFNGGGNLQVQTGNDGTYVFNDVPAGEYTVTVTLDQYLTQEYGQRTLSGKGTPVTLQPGQRMEAIDFQMIKAGVISGTVLDEDGQPMANVQVQALTYEYRNGQRSLRPIGTARATNDLGEYRLYYLTPGDYYVTARANNNNGNRGFDPRQILDALPADQRDTVFQQLRGGRGNQQGGNQNQQGGNQNQQGGRGRGGQNGQDFEAAIRELAVSNPTLQAALQTAQAAVDPAEAYAPSYYPGTMDASQAAAVQLPPSGDIRGIDFSVRPIPTVTLSGLIIQPAVAITPRATTNNTTNNNNNRGNNNNNNNATNNNNRTNNTTNNTAATNNNNRTNNTTNNTAATNNNNRTNNTTNNTAATNNNNRPTNNNNNTANNNNNNNNNRGNNNNNNANNNTANNNNNRGNTNNNANNNNFVRAEIRLVPIGGAALGRGNNNGGGRGGGGGGGFPGGGGGGGGFNNNPVTGRTQVGNDGTFQLTGVIPGAYNLVAVGTTQEDVRVTATQKVDVGYGGNISGLTLALRPGIRVPGRLFPDGTPPTNFEFGRLQVQLELVDDIPNVQNVRATVDATEGTFYIDDVVPGARYRVRMQNQSGAYLQAGLYGTENALSTPIVIENEGTALQLQIGFTPGNVEGTVMDRDKPQRGILTVLVPKDRGRIDLYKTASSGAEGKVTFANVPPGDYKLFAWEEVKEGAWQDALYMEKFEDKGRLVHVEKAGASTETIDLIKSGAE